MAGVLERSTRTTLKKVIVLLVTTGYFAVNYAYVRTVLTGVYACSKCGVDLFYSEKKFQHSSPWPAFTETVRPDSLSKRPDGPSALKV